MTDHAQIVRLPGKTVNDVSAPRQPAPQLLPKPSPVLPNSRAPDRAGHPVWQRSRHFSQPWRQTAHVGDVEHGVGAHGRRAPVVCAQAVFCMQDKAGAGDVEAARLRLARGGWRAASRHTPGSRPPVSSAGQNAILRGARRVCFPIHLREVPAGAYAGIAFPARPAGVLRATPARPVHSCRGRAVEKQRVDRSPLWPAMCVERSNQTASRMSVEQQPTHLFAGFQKVHGEVDVSKETRRCRA